MVIFDLISLGCFKQGDFTLKSGKKSDYYLDLRCLVSHPPVLRKLVIKIRSRIGKTDKICGLPYAGIPYASALSTLYNQPMILLRKEKKEYGTKKMIEGDFVKGEELIIIDDILTTGKSILESLEHFKDFKIKKIVVIVDRQEGGRETLEAMGFQVESIFTLQDFISPK